MHWFAKSRFQPFDQLPVRIVAFVRCHIHERTHVRRLRGRTHHYHLGIVKPMSVPSELPVSAEYLPEPEVVVLASPSPETIRHAVESRVLRRRKQRDPAGELGVWQPEKGSFVQTKSVSEFRFAITNFPRVFASYLRLPIFEKHLRKSDNGKTLRQRKFSLDFPYHIYHGRKNPLNKKGFKLNDFI